VPSAGNRELLARHWREGARLARRAGAHHRQGQIEPLARIANDDAQGRNREMWLAQVDPLIAAGVLVATAMTDAV
jgi:hypothetical protein